MSEKVNKFKVGDEVEIISLTNTDNEHGVVEEMLNVGDRAFIDGCDGETVFLKDDSFSYHIKDFKLIKSVDETNTSQDESIEKGIESDGGSSDYYFTKLPKHMIDQIVETGGIEIKDIIRYVFDNNADAFNIVKAQKRIVESLKGKGKAGITSLYDANKIRFFAEEQYNALNQKES